MSEYIGRVKCRVCVNETDEYCSIKRCKTKSNKSRVCESFIMEEAKIGISIKPKCTKRPDDYWNRKELKKAHKKQIIEALEKQKQAVVSPPSYLDVVNNKHPLTGDLSRFTSSANK